LVDDISEGSGDLHCCMSPARADESKGMTDISVRKHYKTTSRWLSKVGEGLSEKPEGGGVVYTSDRGGLMSRTASTKEGDNVGVLVSKEGLQGQL
jgi:hypothetical protein